ncbi:unnamed protein product [Ophioblennius macclurei]
MAELREEAVDQLHEEDESNKPRRHLSIQASLEALETLVDLQSAGRKSCPLCPDDKFKSSYSHKLRRHLVNLHWKVSVEFKDLRMCICHLPCRRVKTGTGPDQASGKHGAHYHCVVCSVTIARRTDMIGHLRRHSNRGETEHSYHGDASPAHQEDGFQLMKELNTHVQVLPNFSSPQRSDTYFNNKMKINRQLVLCCVSVMSLDRTPLDCLDAFGATGIMGLQWATQLRSAVHVTISDISDVCVRNIRENCRLNNVTPKAPPTDPEGSSSTPNSAASITVEVAKMDANVIMHLRAFDYIHLDPFGSPVNFLDSAFRNIRNLGVVSVTCTDTGTLYAKSPDVTLRHYAARVVRTEYYRELGVRVVVGAVARAAARCNKGVQVLLATALEHFVLVVVRVLRGPSQADESIQKLRTLMHCQWCEERRLGDSLPCGCDGTLPGKTSVQLGPLWAGSLFSGDFLKKMLSAAQRLGGLDDIVPLVKTLLAEAECGAVVTATEIADQSEPRGPKRRRSEKWAEHPPFYYSIHRHSIRGMNMPRLNRFLQHLTDAGYRVSRTHFDPTGVRTDATLAEFKAVLERHSVPTANSVIASSQESG